MGAAQVVHGLNSWSTSNYYRTATAEGFPGSDSMWAGLLLRLDVLPSSNETHFANGATSGWRLRSDSSPSIFGTFTNGAASNTNTPTRALVAGDVGKVHAAAIVHDGTTARLYWNGVEVSTGTAITGYTAAGTNQISVGVRQTGTQPSSFTVLGACGGDQAGDDPSAAEVLAWANACKVAGDIVEISGKTTHLYSVKQDAVDAPAEWVEANATGDNLDEAGTVTYESFAAQWGF